LLGAGWLVESSNVDLSQTRESPRFAGNVVTVGDRSWTVPYPVSDARRIGDRIVVVYDYRCGPVDRAFHNLEAFDEAGVKLWTAESPGTGAEGAYVEFMSAEPLVVWNFTCFRCTIDPADGRLIQAVFTK
jgi:hypothetical protein